MNRNSIFLICLILIIGGIPTLKVSQDLIVNPRSGSLVDFKSNVALIVKNPNNGGLVPYKSDVPIPIVSVVNPKKGRFARVDSEKFFATRPNNHSVAVWHGRKLLIVAEKDPQNGEQDDFILTPDGYAFYMDHKTSDIRWILKFDPIYSSYRFIPGYDIINEGSHGLNGGRGSDPSLYNVTEYRKLFEQEIVKTVVNSENKAMTTSLTETTLSVIDVRSGKQIYTHKLNDASISKVLNISPKQRIGNPVEFNPFDSKSELFCFVRTDVLLQSFSPTSNKPLSKKILATFDEADLNEDMLNYLIGDPWLSSVCVKDKLRHIRFLFFSGQNDTLSADELPLGNELPSNGNTSITSDPNIATGLEDKSIQVRRNIPFHDYSLSSKNALLYNGNSSVPSIQFALEDISRNGDHGIVVLTSQPDSWKVPSKSSTTFFGLLVLLIILIFVLLLRHWFSTKAHDSRRENVVVSKRKKTRKLGKNKIGVRTDKIDESVSLKVGESTNGDAMKPWSNIAEPINAVEGRVIGKLFVSTTEIAKGSSGTVVLEGIYNGRPVAVKRIVKVHLDVALKEIQNLIASDQHQNVVRWYGSESDSDFLYLSLERCTCSLSDLIQICSNSCWNSRFNDNKCEEPVNEYNVRLDLLKGINKDVVLWKANGYPSPQLLKVMRDVVSGLVHLHELGIIHRDLKPHNVLINKDKILCAKLSDMGISKRLLEDMSSFSHHATGYGSSGWQAPEQLLHGRQTRAVDLFSLGCVLFFCITGGKHPFGDRLERDINIVKNYKDLFMVEHIPEAWDLISDLLDPDPEIRPKAFIVLQHPLFWNSEMRLSFLRDASDRVELEDREIESDLLKALENVAPVALGGKWDEKMEATFITNIGHYRRYKFDSVRDLLRVIRNKLNHYRELPKEIQELLGPVSDGFDAYFAMRFPRLLTEVYKVIYKHCGEEECFWKYFKSNLV